MAVKPLEDLDSWIAEGHRIVAELSVTVPAGMRSDKNKNHVKSWLKLVSWSIDHTAAEVEHLREVIEPSKIRKGVEA